MRTTITFAIAFALATLVGCSQILGVGSFHEGSGDDDTCTIGATSSCYDGPDGTVGVGTCAGGTKTCTTGTWGPCVGEVLPVPETCGNTIDTDCDGTYTADQDMDGDGYTACNGDCCDNAQLCPNPAQVNPGAYDVPGDGIDNDCDGVVDDDPAPCDTGLVSNSQTITDYAKAIELCKSASTTDPMKRWGVLGATLTKTDGSPALPAQLPQSAIRVRYGTGVGPKDGASFVLLSTGAAAGEADTSPSPDSGESADYAATASFPADWLAAHGGVLPNSPGCPAATGTTAHDPIMLTLSIRVPTNASSFSFQTNFFSSEFPEWVCSAFNDFYVVLLDSTYAGSPANPADKNLAVYASQFGGVYPIGVNLAFGNTGLFTQCLDGATGCSGSTVGSIESCVGSAELAGTGMEVAAPNECEVNSVVGGATGWLVTTGNVVPGETIRLRIAIWDTSDGSLDSLAVIDAFKWNVNPAIPGTVLAP